MTTYVIAFWDLDTLTQKIIESDTSFSACKKYAYFWNSMVETLESQGKLPPESLAEIEDFCAEFGWDLSILAIS